MALMPSARQRLSADMNAMLDSHPSLAASLEDFEHDDTRSRTSQSPMFGIPSQHSGFRDPSESEAESEPAAQWSPPAWRKESSGWYQRGGGNRFSSHSRSGSRELSPQYGSVVPAGGRGTTPGEVELSVARNIPLPPSPEKMTPRSTVDPEEQDEGDDTQLANGGQRQGTAASRETSMAPPDAPNNYIRFAVRAEVQHRTEPIEAAVTFIREKTDMVTRSWTTTIVSVMIGFLSLTALRSLFSPPGSGPSPDLVKVAGLVHSFEPLIVYSEHGVQQVGELQDTGVAVWDLGESVRHSNMTSAPLIVRELDDLSEGVKRLAIELTRFFANVNGDVDSILITIDWAKRELSKAQNPELGAFQTAFTNIHSVFCKLGVFEGGGKPTAVGKLVTELFGQTAPQRSRAALQRTFNGFLEVLEESISQELKYSTLLFGLFESIERQFLNLARTVQREEDVQDAEEAEFLSSLWVAIMGARASEVKKFERNKTLLATLKGKTLRSKAALREHNSRLMQLKENLEVLRRKLVSPLVRGMDSTLSVEEQIAGLEETHSYLRGVRERQRTKSLEMLYGAGNRAHISQNAAQEISSGR